MNLCTYYAKGVADHVALWGFDDFFIPKGTNKNMLDVIDNAYANPILNPMINLGEDKTERRVSSARGLGWADKHNHPLCYLEIK